MAKAKPTVAEEVVEPVTVELDPFEAITLVRTKFLSGECPFRGLPFRPQLDERCPPVISCVALPVLDQPRGGEARTVVHTTPIVREDDYCWTCLKDQVREREAGEAIFVHREFKRSGKRRR